MSTTISMPVLRTIATDLEKDGRAHLNMFGLVIQIHRGQNGGQLTETRVVTWDKLAYLTIHRAKCMIGEMRTLLDAQEFPDEGE